MSAALGDQFDSVAADRLIGRADGNPFFLEELVRAAAAGSLERIPETVLAVVESRLTKLEPEARRVLRAASVFGEVAWDGGVRALLGARHAAAVFSWLEILVDREVLVRKPAGRFARQAEYGFSHALSRESAYATLTEEDRRVAHALAGDWLESAGERDGLVLAEHFEQGACGPRAAIWLAHPASEALAGMSLTSALDITQRGILLTEPNDVRGRLYYLRGSALNWLGRLSEALAARRVALEFLQPGSETWFASLAGICYSAAQTGDHDAVKNCLAAAEGTGFQVAPTGVWGFAGGLFGMTLAFMAWRTEAERAFHRTYGAVTDSSARLQSTPNDDDDPVFHGWRYLTESIIAGWLHDDVPSAVRAGRASVAWFDLAGHRLGGSCSRAFLSGALTWAGAYGSASECIEAIPPTNTGSVAALVRLFGALLHEQTGHPYRARLLLDSDALRAQGLLWSVFGRCVLTACAYREEMFPDALRMAEETRMEADSVAAMIPRCDAIVAAVRGRQGNHLEALAVATRGLEAAQSAAHPDSRSQLALTRAESLHALGRLDEARDAIRSARDRILRIAAAFEREAMPEFRESWLGNVSQNVRTLELASEWLGEAR